MPSDYQQLTKYFFVTLVLYHLHFSQKKQYLCSRFQLYLRDYLEISISKQICFIWFSHPNIA